MIAKEQYKALCETEGSAIPLFLQYWWMEAVCEGKRWDVALSFRNGEIVGAMPYLLGRRMGMRYILQPQLTQYNGPWYRYPEDFDECRRLSFEKQVAQDLWEQILSLRPAYYQQNFSPAVTNWLPFYWAGCQQTTRYTYRIDDISDPQRVFDAFEPSRRQRQIRRTEGVLHPVPVTPERFVEFHTDYWARRGERDLLTAPFMLRVMGAALGRGQGLLLGLEDGDGVLQGARFVVYDDRCAYSLLSALGEGHPNGTSARLSFEIIKRLAGSTRAFDFEGSMDEGIEYFYRSFGTVQTPYFHVTRCFNPLFRVLLQAQRFKEKHF